MQVLKIEAGICFVIKLVYPTNISDILVIVSPVKLINGNSIFIISKIYPKFDIRNLSCALFPFTSILDI